MRYIEYYKDNTYRKNQPYLSIGSSSTRNLGNLQKFSKTHTDDYFKKFLIALDR